MSIDAVALIERKRDGLPLASREVSDLIAAYCAGQLPDYQMAALAMAIYFRGMSESETAALTNAMLCSGTCLQWPADCPPIVDKHSTGGVGDKVSLVLAPLLACCDVWVPMISGRGLGPTGGTLDKLESIPGFKTQLSIDEITAITQRVGCVIAGATAEIAPADRKLYSLRDVTGTVPSIPLITASIMSKKLAESLDSLVLDVKCGGGAFMKNITDARALANSLVASGNRCGVATSAVITDMNQPLGRAVGNAIEVREAMQALQGDGPADLIQVTCVLGGVLLVLAGRAVTPAEGACQLEEQVASGAGYQKFLEMVRAQGGRLEKELPIAEADVIQADTAGHVHAVDVATLARSVIGLGGGRRVVTDSIDHAVGFEMLVKVGDQVRSGQPILKVFADSQQRQRMRTRLRDVVDIQEPPAATSPLIIETIGSPV